MRANLTGKCPDCGNGRPLDQELAVGRTVASRGASDGRVTGAEEGMADVADAGAVVRDCRAPVA